MRVTIALVGLMVGVAMAWGSTTTACATTSQTKTEQDAQYLGEQLACVDQAKTLDESRACRLAVKQRWGFEGGLQ